ncbi:hypothetical protein EsDP_00001417 [Epichloe bromicola]|uniref:AA1-like domain-containing protein n=1 Tax=Epichloe bromicola TaxID=79588 RepID=A0ABQ0CIA0_9HYPO
MHVSACALLLATAAAMAAPSTNDPRKPETCTQKARNAKQWQVKDFDFHASYLFTTPAHQISSGHVNFTLENPALGFTSRCEASSGHLDGFFYGDMAYNCTEPVPGPRTTFTFSRPSGELNVNQTWSCRDEKSTFWAQGGTKLELDCEDKRWTNPDWKMGQTYSTRFVTCGRVNATVPIKSMQGIA